MREQVRIVEVGPRDGLQNEATPIPTADKLGFVRGLVAAGLRDIEVTSFVHPARVPQLADAAELLAALEPMAGVRYSALVPNPKGLERARACGVARIAVFTAASQTFTQKNIGMGIEESLAVFAPVVQAAREAGMTVRGYVSTCFVCPYEGEIAPAAVTRVARALLAMGCDEISLGDTIGAAVPRDVHALLDALEGEVPLPQLALHMHDTYGTALANVCAGLERGIRVFDASAGGLGGCPYAPGASGNLATEDLVYLLERMGLATGVELEKLAQASSRLANILGRPLPGRVLARLQAQGRAGL